MSTKLRSRKGSSSSRSSSRNINSNSNKTTAATSISSSIEETTKKVVSTVISSIEDHVSSKQFDSTKDGLDFLEVKNSLLVSYLIDLTKLLQYQHTQKTHNQSKPNKASIKENTKTKKEMKQCIKRLNEMKVIIEKIKPLEKKMRYQIDKLLTLSSTSSSFALTVEDDGDEDDNNDEEVDDMDGNNNKETKRGREDVQMEESDPLAFRPNLAGFGNDDDDDEEEKDGGDSDESNDDDNDESDDEELQAAKEALKAGRSSKNQNENDNIYKAPRLTAVPFAEKEKQKMKDDRLQKKQRDRMKKSELLSTLKATYGDMPEEDDVGGGSSLGTQRESARRFAEHEAEKTKFEEETFVRLTTSKKEKKMRNKIMREEVSNLHSIADIGNLTAGVSFAFGDGGKGGGYGGNDDDDDEIIRVGGGSSKESARHVNGKRRRANEYEEDNGGSRKGNHRGKRRNEGAKNSFQKALFGTGGDGGGKSGKKKKNKR